MHRLYNEKVLKLFIFLQPVVDIITSIMINEYNLSLSLGMVVRFLFLLYACGYLFLHRNKKTIFYGILFALYIGTNLVGNMLVKDSFQVFTQFGFLLKMIYLPAILLFWITYFKQNKELDKKIFVYVAILIGFSLLISCLTKTAYCSYATSEDCYQKGVVAWFNSANEYGLILIALLGFSTIEFLKKGDYINITSLLFTIIFLCILGTKASYIGAIGVISVYIVYYFIASFFDRKKFNNLNKTLFLIAVLFIIALSTSKLPIYTNLVTSYSRAVAIASTNSEECEEGQYCKTDIYKTEAEVQEEVTQNLVFNGREDYVKINWSIYKNSSIFHKLFGITTQGNYYEGQSYDHISERDFHDLLMYYGVVGFILEMLLPFYLVIQIGKKLSKNIKVLWNDETVLLGIVISMILFGSFLAGHCLFQPAVSIYLAYLVALLYKKVMG